MKRGFTMFELLLVMGAVAVLAGASLPIYRFFGVENDLNLAVDAATHLLRRAQLLAHAGAEDSSWGVRFGSGEIILFRGESFSLSDPDSRESLPLASGIVATGREEIVFSRFSAEPTEPGAVTLQMGSRTREVDVSPKGTISF